MPGRNFLIVGSEYQQQGLLQFHVHRRGNDGQQLLEELAAGRRISFRRKITHEVEFLVQGCLRGRDRGRSRPADPQPSPQARLHRVP